MRRLFPAAPPVAQCADREWGLSELAEAYAYPATHAAGSGWLRANMVSSLDGAAQHDGRSRGLSGDADMRIFGVLRALADVVVVGAETVRTEKYRPARARREFAASRAAAGQPPAPAIAVLSASLHLDFSQPLFSAPTVPTLVVTGAAAPAAAMAAAERAGVEVVIAGEGAEVDPGRARAELVRRGFTRLLTEGGPRLLGQFATADEVDEMCLTVAPRITVGTASRVMSGLSLEVPRDLTLVGMLEDAGFLFLRYHRV